MGCRALAFLLVSVFAFAALAKEGDGGCVPRNGARGHVAAVSQRLELTLADGRILRLAGVEAPGPTPTDPDLGTRAHDWLATWLENRDILFELLEIRPDRWGRYAAVVFAPLLPEDTASVMVTNRLLEQGFARRVPDQVKISCADALLQAEKAARAAGRGLWSDPYYAVVSATDGEAFPERLGSFIVAQGQVSGMRETSARTLLFFGPHRRSHLTVTILQRNVKIFEAAGLHFHDLIGQTLRVRGLLENRFGPELELTNPNEVELIARDLSETAKPAPDVPAVKQP